MPREIAFGEDALDIRYTGLDRLIVFLRRLRVPYSRIASVEIGLEQVPRFPAWRVGTAVPFTDIWRGRFGGQGERWFMDFHDRRKAVVARLRPSSDDRLTIVALQTEDPEEFAAELEARVRAASA